MTLIHNKTLLQEFGEVLNEVSEVISKERVGESLRCSVGPTSFDKAGLVRFFHDREIRSHTIAYILDMTVDEVDIVRDEYEATLRDAEKYYYEHEWPRVRAEIDYIRSHVQKKDTDEVSSEQIQRARDYPLEKLLKSRNGMALCPFHKETTPSLNIKKNFYYCHGCGEHGDTIALLMKRDGLSFQQAVLKLT